MAAQVTIDVRSFIIGALVGVVILFAVGAWYWDRQEMFPAADTAEARSDQVEEATPDADALDYAAQFEHQQRVEDALQTRAQTMLDQIIGRNRSTVGSTPIWISSTAQRSLARSNPMAVR